MLSNFLTIMRGETASTLMWWLNFFVLLFLIYKFVFPLILKMLEENLTEIETILSAEEAEKRKLEERKVELQRSIDNIEGERSRLIDEATVQASTIKKEILTDARELEMRIFDNVEKNAAGYYYKKLDNLKNQIFGQVSDSFKNDHSENPKAKARQTYDSNVIQKVGS
jgi:F0F1-type ATP synthase membrane subunit b/b'